MNFATMILPQRVVEALGWTLFHSLWQGALAALGFAVILYFSRRTSSRMRYGLGLAVLALMLLVSLLTFRNHYSASGPAAVAPRPVLAAAAAAPLPAAAGPALVAPGEPTRSQRIMAFFSDYFSRHLPLLVTLWLLGVLFLTLRFSGSMLYLQRLKYKQNRPLPQPWPERLQQLAEKAGLQRPLQLLESLRLRTPVVIGHLKPVLLLPAGLVSGLPVDEVEALLAHELAHVVRRDYLVNVLQNLVEILYFFHPGVRWISAGVRQERELCCDDFAVALCGDAQNYARALARLQIDGVSYPEPALAAVGRPQRLLRRIVRLLRRPNLALRSGPRTAHDFREGYVSALLLVFGLLGMLKLAAVSGGAVPVAVGATPPGLQAGKAPAANPFAHVSFDLEADVVVRLSGAGNGGSGTWLVDGRDGQVIWYMDLARAGAKGSFNAEVPLGRGAYSWYRPIGWQVTASRQGAAGKGPWQPLTMFIGDRKRRPADPSAGERDAVKAEEQAQHERQQATLKAEQELQEEKRLRSEKERRSKEEELRELELALAAKSDAEQKMKDLEIEKYQMELQVEEMALKTRLNKEKITAEDRYNLARLEELKAKEQRLRGEEKRLRDEENNFQALIAELYAAGAVGKSGRYQVKLSPQALLVNGSKQPPAMHERVKKFYEKQFDAKLTGERTIQFDND